MLNLRWLLLDFGRRGNALDAAKERLMSANLAFNRKHQEIVFHVQSAFLALTSHQRKIAVAQSALDAGRSVREAAEGQLQGGLATLPEVSLARQQEAQAAFDLEDALARERDAQVTLAESPSAAHLAAIRHALTAATKKDVQIDVKVDPSLLGGLVVRIGSRMILAAHNRVGNVRSRMLTRCA